jgi:hypothetical protein
VIQRQASQIALDLGQKPPSYRVVRAVVKAIPADLLALAHEGKKGLQRNFRVGVSPRSRPAERDLASGSFVTGHFDSF